MFGQVIKRVGKITNFGLKKSKGFGKRAAHPNLIFLEVTPQPTRVAIKLLYRQGLDNP